MKHLSSLKPVLLHISFILISAAAFSFAYFFGFGGLIVGVLVMSAALYLIGLMLSEPEN